MRLPEGTRAALLGRAQGRCERCGGPLLSGWDGWSAHHRQPRGMGGSRDPGVHSLANLLALCGSGTTGCHGRIERKRAEAYDFGWLVRRPLDPATVPVQVRSQWVLLDPAGHYEPHAPREGSSRPA